MRYRKERKKKLGHAFDLSKVLQNSKFRDEKKKKQKTEKKKENT